MSISVAAQNLMFNTTIGAGKPGRDGFLDQRRARYVHLVPVYTVILGRTTIWCSPR